MSDILIGAGEDFSLLPRGTVTVNSEDSSRPRSRLYDGRTSLVYRAAAAIADLRIVCDGDLLKGAGTFESGVSFLTSISSGAGSAPAEETTIVDVGSKALRLTSGASGQSGGQVDVWVRAGERLNLSVRLRGDGTRLARLRIYDPRTGSYLTSGAVWDTPGAAAVDVASRSAATYATSAVTFTMPAFSSLRVPRVPLRIQILNTTTSVGNAYADQLFVWPSWDFFSLHGTRNLGPVTPQFQSSSDGSAWTTRGTATVYVPSFWHRLSAARDERYAGLLLQGTNHEAIEASELVIGDILATTSHPDMGYEIGHLADVITNESPSGEKFAAARSQYLRRTLGMRLAHRADADFREFRDEVFGRALGPVNPLVVVPDSDKPEVIHGRIDRQWKVRRSFLDYYDENDLVVAEDPFPPDRS